jgi:hypothetical protein
MKPVHAAIIRLLDRLQERFRRARAGSVLILVVALLVLMALLGTAFISTARIDRYGAAQNAANTEIDLLVEGVKNMVTGAILDDRRDAAGNYRPPGQAIGTTTYEHSDSPLVDLFLASRVPTGAAATPVWRGVSWPLIQNGPTATPPQYQFESPGQQAPVTLIPTATVGDAPKRDYRCVVSSGLFAGDPLWPHLRIFDSGGEVTTAPGIPAADADGDGIADAGLWKLPISPIDGITYYVATRIIDNNSAINGSTAWKPTDGTDPNDIPGNSFFPSEINLEGMLKGTAATAMGELNTYRTGDATAIPLTPTTGDNAPYGQAAMARADVEFINPREALQMQLGRRLDNPSYKTGGATGIRYQAIPFSASASLAYRFCLQNQSGIPSVFEQAAYPTLRTSFAPTKTLPGSPYPADQFSAWFNDNFAYGPGATMPLRALTVARNPVANARPSHSVQANSPIPPTPAAGRAGDRGLWATATQYIFGDWVNTPTGQRYLCIKPHTSSPADDPTVALGDGTPTAFWERVPWTDQPLKANINTAAFGELWHAFWDVMVETPEATPWVQPNMAATGMFRNSSRDPRLTGQVIFSAYNMLQLRSALAAVNAMDLRDSDNDVTSRTIRLTTDSTSGGAAGLYDVTVYGSERQPYITEVLVDTGAGAGQGYIAIELYNPYPYPIVVDNWRLVAVDRDIATPPDRTVTDLLGGTAPAGLGTLASTVYGGPVIPPYQFLVIDNQDPAGAPIRPVDVTITGTAVYAPLLTTAAPNGAFGREITILRPRKASGVPSASFVPGNVYDEGSAAAPIFKAMVPVDQVDLFGVVPSAISPQRYNYRRASNPAVQAGLAANGTAWNFVSAGPYVVNPAPTFLRQSGLLTPLTPPRDGGNLGVLDNYFSLVATSATFLTRVVQIANVDFGGPNKMVDQTSAVDAPLGAPYRFPYGAFARNGDILQVPFIGAYAIRDVDAAPETLRDWNSLPMDAAFADDGDAADDPTPNDAANGTPREQLGRFCPVGDPATASNDFNHDPAAANAWRYHWALDLFDHLTVQAPNNDFMPDVDPTPPGGALESPPSPAKYPGYVAAGANTPPLPSPVANAKYSEANDYDPLPADPANVISPEGSKVPVEGLVNINTAPWKVLAALPLLPAPFTQNEINLLAQDIVAYRDGLATPGAPFQSIYDLYKVPNFAARQATLLATDPDDLSGDISPKNPPPTGSPTPEDGARMDFEERFLLLNRISNMITTRSDSYTVYLLVQGWQDAGTANPQLRTQRRLAFIVDRSRINPAAPQMTVTPVPNN